jgi:hypothetical protein
MARQVFVWRDGEVVDRATVGALHDAADAPMVRADGMDAIRSMADGKLYDSRSGYYASLKAQGREIVGNERGAFDRRPEWQSHGNVGRDIIKTAQKMGVWRD